MDWLQESYPTHWYLFYSKVKQALQRRQRILAYCQLLRKDIQAFPDSSLGKESACNAGDPSSIAGSGRSPGEGTGYPLQYSDLENSMDCTVHGVAKSWTWLTEQFSLSLPWQQWVLKKTSRWFVCLVAQSCPTLCDSMDCSLPGSSAHGIFLGTILE